MTALAEFARPVRLDTLGTAPHALSIAAEPGERAALARRLGLIAVEMLAADTTLVRAGDIVTLTGRVRATVTQACVATGAPVEAAVDEPMLIRFLPNALLAAGDEVELDEADCDVEPHDGRVVDVGEAAAATLALALDPFPRAPGADAALKAAGVIGEGETGAFAGLAALRDQLRDGKR